MRNGRFILLYLLILAVNVAVEAICDVSALVVLSVLPALVVSIPVRFNTHFAMCMAFLTGLAMDFLAGGCLGVNACALTLVGALRRPLLARAFGDEFLERGESISITRQGLAKCLAVLVLACGVFLLAYFIVDGAGMRPFGLSVLGYALSLALSVACSTVVLSILQPERRSQWK